jgi:MOSC domain-containing protein YiiM
MAQPTEHVQVRITHILTSPGHDFKGRHGEPRLENGTKTHECVACLPGRGLQGDRYAEKEYGHKGQVTFFNGEVLREVGAALGLDQVPPDAFRRNVILEGVDVNDLVGRTFSLGGVRFEGTEASRPCHWMDVALVPGTRELLRGKGGLRAKILDAGILRTGTTELVLENMENRC